MEIYYQYVRLRRQFGRHAKFTDGGAEMLADIRPNADHAAACVPKNPATTVAQYRKKVEKDEEFVRTLAALGAAVEGLIKQNNSVDIYEEYFADYAADHSAEPPTAATVTVFRDPKAGPGAPRRAASCVSWHPDGAAKAVVAYSILGRS
ncbi:Dynein, intermediate chain, flagellar outer arm [Monoraphidium neglectum]|uniref:Dynein, intermediate chain, flagellar outer arm n=1 Tax=Monoraphidium neglectum TaxID=145388 RepID=A0A0D2LIJ3_9CHLO|nr:Dynein, intermediate chain, flagellar outer arm [Monoraphidium neglectum]KIY91839.1 Dynein, intermediate chain, flagellar outer arm [Monoraphidium neglectum]|eukprot:XP_013890859.1 Dynein, intermediate chain, flagellar outer arm [Monoraphidium neglectum]